LPLSEGAKCAHGRISHRRLRIVDTPNQRLSSALNIEPASHARGGGPDAGIVVIERLDQLRGVAFAERRPRNCSDRIDRLGAHLRVVIVDGLQQGIDYFGRRRPGLDGERAHFKCRGRLAGVADLDDKPQTLLCRQVVGEKERQLGPDRFELDLVHGVVDQRSHRHNRFRVPGFMKQLHRREPHLGIGISQVADHVVEPHLLRGERGRDADEREGPGKG
jgi:hypothetical protein